MKRISSISSAKILMLLSVMISGMLISCEDPLQFRGDVTDSKVVVNATVQDDQPVSLNLTWSRFFLSSAPFKNIEDATATLMVNGVPYSAQNNGNGNYTFNYIPQPHDSLSLTLAVPGRPEVTAGTRMPGNFEVGTLDVQDLENENIRFRLSFKDNAGEANYYRLSCLRTDSMIVYHRNQETGDWEFSNTEQQYNNSKVYMSMSDALLSDEVNMGNMIDSDDPYSIEGNSILFSDQKIDGKSHTLDFTIYLYKDNTYITNYGEDSVVFSYTFDVRLESVTRDLYLYRKTVDAQNEDEFGGFFSEPVQIHQNIHNGLGIFAGSIGKTRRYTTYSRDWNSGDYPYYYEKKRSKR